MQLLKNVKGGGGIGFFGFAVLVTFEIGFSVFALKIPGVSVLVSTAVFGYSLFDIGVSVFMTKKNGYSVLASNWRIVRSFFISLQKFHLHMSRRQWKK